MLTYVLIPWNRVLLEKLTGFQLVKKSPAFHGTRSFITAVTSTRHLSLSWASSIQSTTILPSHRLPCLPSDLLSSLFLKPLYKFLLSPMHATSPTNLILLHSFTLQCLMTDIKTLLIMQFLLIPSFAYPCSKHAFLD